MHIYIFAYFVDFSSASSCSWWKSGHLTLKRVGTSHLKEWAPHTSWRSDHLTFHEGATTSHFIIESSWRSGHLPFLGPTPQWNPTSSQFLDPSCIHHSHLSCLGLMSEDAFIHMLACRRGFNQAFTKGIEVLPTLRYARSEYHTHIVHQVITRSSLGHHQVITRSLPGHQVNDRTL